MSLPSRVVTMSLFIREPMAKAARYLFDRTFDVAARGSESNRAAARLSPEEWEGKMAEASRAAFEKGRAEGVAETLKGIESDTRDQVNALLQSAQRLLGGVEQQCSAIRKNAIELATTTATLLAQELTNRLPTANLEALVTEALEHMGDAPHIALSVNDAHAQRIQKVVTSIAAERGYTGKIVVLGDPETKVGDCSLQWADGGILLDQDKTRSTITGIVKRHLDRLTRDSAVPPAATGVADATLPLETTGAADTTLTGGQSETGIEAKTITGSGEQK